MPDLKRLFDTPQKARTAVICAAVAIATIGAVAAYIVLALPGQSPAGEASAPPSQAVSPSPAPSDAPSDPGALMGVVPSLTIDEARVLALADAGLADGEADVSREALTDRNGIWVYEFKFRAGNTSYAYEINANTGAVYSKASETYVYASAAPEGSSPPPAQESVPAMPSALPASRPPAVPSSPPASQPPASAAPQFTLEDAKAAALADAGVDAAQATFTKTAPDYDDGMLVYDVEFYTGDCEYEYEIDAATGRVYAKSAEAFQPPAQHHAPGSGTTIGIDKAKAAALSHAGFTADQVRITKTEMDRDDGRMVYEIEFLSGGVEYEYKIDAQTGDVLEYEHDQH